MTSQPPDRTWLQGIDWGSLVPLRLRARSVVEGVYAGMHRSVRRGPGVEFGGHRPYVPGDDLRWLDRHALMRHDRLMVRQFEMETDRGLHLIVDATASMSFRGASAPGSKFAFAALLTAALSLIGLADGDPVSISWVGGKDARPVRATSGGDAFERIVQCLSSIQAAGDFSSDLRSFERVLLPISRRARRGSVVILLSDLLDLPAGAEHAFAALATGGRRLLALQILDPDEVSLPYEGTVRLHSLEGNLEVETQVEDVRARYIQALDDLTQRWSSPLSNRNARLVRAVTNDDPVAIIHRSLRATAEGPP